MDFSDENDIYLKETISEELDEIVNNGELPEPIRIEVEKLLGYQ